MKITLKTVLVSLFLFLVLPVAALCAENHKQIAQTFGNTIVTVNVARMDGSTHSGTGFIVNPAGVIATAAHVVEDAIFVNVTFVNGALSGEAEVIAISPDPDIDLALLQIRGENLPYVIFKKSNSVRAGDDITVIGSPRRLQNTITEGLVSQLRRVSKTVVWQQISAPLSPSSSGSPVFNKDGYVIGVALNSVDGAQNQNLNFAIPSNYLLQLMTDAQVLADLDSKPAKNKINMTLAPQKMYERARNHIAKSWRILKVRILRMKP